MLADVLKSQQEEKQRLLEEERAKYNQPYKRDTIIYCQDIHIIGGIETWIQNLAKKYEFSVVYDTGDKPRLEQYEELGIEAIKYVGQPIECNTLISMLFGSPEKIKAKKKIIVIHGDYKVLKYDEVPEHDEIYAVSKEAAKSFEEVSGEKVKVLYNPVEIIPTIKPLFIGVFSRLSAEKGRERYKYLIEQLDKFKKPYLMLIFTDLPFETKSKNVVFIPPEMKPSGWMEKCDYIANLSDTEAGCLTMQEALKLKKPLIITRLPILEEFGINESNAKILDFDMSNLDIEDLWNIPVVKDWKEPSSKEWDDIMKKKVLREKREIPVQVVEEIKEEKPKKTSKKVK